MVTPEDEPTVVEFTDGSTGALPSVAEYHRMAEQNERDWEELKRNPLIQSILNFDLSE